MDTLNPRQENFVINYVTNGYNAYQAAKEAGYTEQTALTRTGEMLQLPAIKERIERATARINEKLEKKLGITIEHKAKLLKRIIDDCMPDNTENISAKRYEVVLKSIDMLNKMQGHYAPNRSLAVTVDATKDKLIEARRQYEEF